MQDKKSTNKLNDRVNLAFVAALYTTSGVTGLSVGDELFGKSTKAVVCTDIYGLNTTKSNECLQEGMGDVELGQKYGEVYEKVGPVGVMAFAVVNRILQTPWKAASAIEGGASAVTYYSEQVRGSDENTFEEFNNG